MDDAFVFDVDGTLTPHRQVIDPTFRNEFIDWAKSKNVFLASGSDYVKLIEQVGVKVLNDVAGVFSSSGNALHKNGELQWQNHALDDPKLIGVLDKMLQASAYPDRTGLHFEHRPGMLNFSVVGRNASFDDRAAYFEYDKLCKERNLIAARVRTLGYDASIGGQISVDIFPPGGDKRQIVHYFDNDTTIYFFGDRMAPEGNDESLAHALLKRGNAVLYHVTSCDMTREILSGWS